MQVGGSAVATRLGQILDADVYFNPRGSPTTYATPQALASNPAAYDLESVLTHELGHTLGFSHSSVWSAIMFPFAAAPGTFSGMRPPVQQPDAPLGDDDRTGLRVVFANPAAGLRGAARFTPGSNRSFWGAGCRCGCGQRRSRGCDDGRMELLGGWAGAV
jgi:hypothetical protein